jgi:hypothetical protein
VPGLSPLPMLATLGLRVTLLHVSVHAMAKDVKKNALLATALVLIIVLGGRIGPSREPAVRDVHRDVH